MNFKYKNKIKTLATITYAALALFITTAIYAENSPKSSKARVINSVNEVMYEDSQYVATMASKAAAESDFGGAQKILLSIEELVEAHEARRLFKQNRKADEPKPSKEVLPDLVTKIKKVYTAASKDRQRKKQSSIPSEVKDSLSSILDSIAVEQYSKAQDLILKAKEIIQCAHSKKDKLGNIVQWTNDRGLTTNFEYDAIARLKKIIHSDRENTLEYEPEGFVSKQTAPDGSTTAYTYTTQGWLLSKTLPNGFTEQYRYDLLGRLVYTLTQESETTYEYQDAQNHLIVTTNGVKTFFDYDALGQINRYQDEQGGVYCFKYNGFGDVVEVMNPAQEVIRYSYDYANNIRIKTLPSGATEHITFDALGRPTIITLQDASEAWIETKKYKYQDYDGYTVCGERAPKSRQPCSCSRFDEKGRLISISKQISDMYSIYESFVYDTSGNLVKYTDFKNEVYTYEYNDHDELLKEVRPDGSQISHEYDKAGRRTLTRFPKGVTLYYEYDSKTGEKRGERLVYGENEQRGIVFELDEKSRIVRKQDPRGISLAYVYDAFNRVISIKSDSGECLAYEYTATGDIMQIKHVAADGSEVTIDREYDGIGRLLAEHVNIDGALHQSAAQTWSDQNRIGLVLAAQGHSHELAHAYTASGKLHQVHCSQYDYALKYNYNDKGQHVFLEDKFLRRFMDEYGPEGYLPVRATTHYNKFNGSWTEHKKILIEMLDWRGPEVLRGYMRRRQDKTGEDYACYRYDAMGRLLSYRDRVHLNGSKYRDQWGYNVPVHMQSESWYCGKDTATQGEYHYDELGVMQRRSACDEGHCTDYRVGEQVGNQVNTECLAQDAGIEACSQEGAAQDGRVYDAAGNLIELRKSNGDVFKYEWSAWGELVKVTCEGKFEWAAIYDGLGRRLMTTYQAEGQPAQVTKSYYDPEVEFLEIGVGRGEELAWKIYGNDLNGIYGGLQGIGGLQAIINACTGEIIKPIQDLQGNIVGYINCDGPQWKDEVHYDAYGPIGDSSEQSLDKIDCSLPLEQALVKAHSWRGKRTDPTGLIYMGSRYYDSNTGRFISPDPYGHEGSIDLYSYANGNPVIYCDPDGRFFSAVYEGSQQRLDQVQTGLDVAGAVPAFGAAPDAGNLLINLARGNWEGAGLSAMGLAMHAGMVSTASTGVGAPVAVELATVNAAMRTARNAKAISKGAKAAAEVLKGVDALPSTGKFYSVAFETKLAQTSYPGVTRYMHFKEANTALAAAIKSNPALAKLGISVSKSPSGAILGKSPENWVWHHDTTAGIMQLVPKSQHPNIPGGIFWETMHPGGSGGYSIWGK